MKNLFFILLFLLGNSPAWAQLEGRIFTEQGAPLAFVNVLLLNAGDSSMVKGSLSGEDGRFRIEGVEAGSYLLQARMVGFESWSSAAFSISKSRPQKQFGSITLAEEAFLMDGVTVTARKADIERSAEGISLNLEGSLMSRGSNVLQILERSPGVILDQQNNSLSLNGQSGTLIMINGKPIRLSPAEVMNMLEGMSADNLEKVELLSQPSARYDADGGGGIINLITKSREDEGTNASMSASIGYGTGQKEGLSLNLYHRKGATSFSSSYSFQYDDSFNDFRAIGQRNMAILGGDVHYDYHNHVARRRASHNASAGIEKELEKGWLLGGDLLYTHSRLNSHINNVASYGFEDLSFLNADINIRGTATQQNLNTGFFAEKQFEKEGKLSLNADYLYYDHHSPTHVQISYLDKEGNAVDPGREVFAPSNRGESTTDLNIGVLKLDYEGRIGKHIRLESGIKASYAQTLNYAKIESLQEGKWVTDGRSNSRQRLIEKTGASYLSLSLKLDSLTQITSGLRYELWDRDFNENNLDKTTGMFFPSVFLSRSLSRASSIQLVYNRRITRPDYQDLTNFLRYSDPVSVFTGTPELLPAITDRFKLDFQHQGRSFALFYSWEENPIARFQLLNKGRDDLFMVAPENMDFLRSIGMQLHVPLEIMKAWDVSTGGSFAQRRFALSYTLLPVEKDYLAYNLYLNQYFSLPWDLSAELTALYNSSQYNGSIKIHPNGGFNFGIKKDFGEKYGSLQFTVSDLLKSMGGKIAYGAITREVFDSRSTVSFRPESAHSRIYRLSYSLSFGNSKAGKAKERSSGSQEERSRIGQ